MLALAQSAGPTKVQVETETGPPVSFEFDRALRYAKREWVRFRKGLSSELLGVPCLIRADGGIYTKGPASRRGGLAGGPSYPP
jgi:hypothetical protein